MYNTLECMRSIGIDYGSGEIVQISTGLADILRYCLSTDFQVPLERELEIVAKYASIIQFRFDERYTFEIEADASVREIDVVKMIIQPIVENAVFHGLEKRRTGHLRISCIRQDDLVLIEVSDNGQGMGADQLAKVRGALSRTGGSGDGAVTDRRGIGLVNIHRRVETFYGEQYGLRIDSAPDSGTTVAIRLPVLVEHVSPRIGS
jgi:two-component system sensor histidine kinase YesM